MKGTCKRVLQNGLLESAKSRMRVPATASAPIIFYQVLFVFSMCQSLEKSPVERKSIILRLQHCARAKRYFRTYTPCRTYESSRMDGFIVFVFRNMSNSYI